MDRVWQRQISTGQLEQLLEWLEREPEVSNGRRFKRFPRLTVCGEGELIKTFLRPEQAATGDELK
jgi:hypothetical protein